MDAQEVIKALGLTQHPKERGYFRETYRADETLRDAALDRRYGKTHNVSTAIYFLLCDDGFSEFHKLKSDEVFHFYLGDPAQLCILAEDGTLRSVTMGPDLSGGQVLQAVVPRQTWQGLYLPGGSSWALLGCTVAPGFDYDDYESGERTRLIEQFPQHGDLIARLTVQ